jgi:hypothetical protein
MAVTGDKQDRGRGGGEGEGEAVNAVGSEKKDTGMYTQTVHTAMVMMITITKWYLQRTVLDGNVTLTAPMAVVLGTCTAVDNTGTATRRVSCCDMERAHVCMIDRRAILKKTR